MNNKLVYSTDKNVDASTKKSSSNAPLAAGPLKMRLESNGRGGKQVTVLFHLLFTEADAKMHQKALQSKLGVGGTYKDGKIEIRGDLREKIELYFAGLQIKVVRAGG